MERKYSVKTRYKDYRDKILANRKLLHLVQDNLENILDNDYIAVPLSKDARIVMLGLMLKKRKLCCGDSVLRSSIQRNYYAFLQETIVSGKDFLIRYAVSDAYSFSEAHNRFMIYNYPKKEFVETYWKIHNPEYELPEDVTSSEWILETDERLGRLEKEKIKNL